MKFLRCVARGFCCVAGARADDEWRCDGDVTRLRVTSQVILSGVTRLGVNLGEQNFYDSGQMLKNLLCAESRLCGNEVSQHFSLRNRRGRPLRGYAGGNSVPDGLLERRVLRGAGGLQRKARRGTVKAADRVRADMY